MHKSGRPAMHPASGVSRKRRRPKAATDTDLPGKEELSGEGDGGGASDSFALVPAAVLQVRTVC